MNAGEKILVGRCGWAWEKCGAEAKGHGSEVHIADARDDAKANGKGGASWDMCSMAKTRCMKDGEKILVGRCGWAWEKCGAEAKGHGSEANIADAKDDATANGKGGASRWDMCSMAKTRCTKDGEKILVGRCGWAWEKCGAGLGARNMKAESVNVKDCFFDKECHGRVNREKITKIKEAFLARLKVYKAQSNKNAVNDMMTKMHTVFRGAGVPDDRINHMITNWVKDVYPEAVEGCEWAWQTCDSEKGDRSTETILV